MGLNLRNTFTGLGLLVATLTNAQLVEYEPENKATICFEETYEWQSSPTAPTKFCSDYYFFYDVDSNGTMDKVSILLDGEGRGTRIPAVRDGVLEDFGFGVAPKDLGYENKIRYSTKPETDSDWVEQVYQNILRKKKEYEKKESSEWLGSEERDFRNPQIYVCE